MKNTQHEKGALVRLKSLTVSLEEKEQEAGYVTGKISEMESDILKMESRIRHYREVSLPAYRVRSFALSNDIQTIKAEIETAQPKAEIEREYETKQAKIASLEAEIRKFQRS